MAITKVTRNMLNTGIVDNSNATAITIDSSENVGIGTTSPLVKTHVHNGSDAKNIVLITGADTTTEYLGLGTESGIGYITSGSSSSDSHSLAFRYAASGVETEAMRIDSSGKVGIGETSPLGKLHVKTADSGVSSANANADDLIVENSDYTGISILGENESNIHFGDNEDPDVGRIEYSHSSNHMVFRTNGSDKMLINSSGNVGIGTTSPSETLHVKRADGTALIVESSNDQNNTGDRINIEFRTDGSQGIAKIIGGKEGNYQGSTVRSGYLAFQNINANSYAESMRISSTGVVMIGTTTSKSAGDNPTDENSTVIGRGYLYLQRDDSAEINQIVFGKDGQIAGRIVTTTATSLVSASDYRMKENVDYTWDATTRLKQLKPARYNWIADETNTLEDGFLAHEVSSVVPNAVFGEKDAVDSDGNAEMQGVDQSKLVPLLVKTIQELEARITTLEG